MLANDIQKGAKILYRGMEGEVLDNKKRLSRKIKFQGPMGPAKGDSYLFDWVKVVVNGVREEVQLDEEQRSEADMIRKMPGR